MFVQNGEKSLKKNSLYNVTYNMANILFPLITSIYVARILLTEGIGKVAYGQNIASYFIVFASLGLPTYGVREIAKVNEDKKRTNKLFTELLIINAGFTTIATIVYILLIFNIDRFQHDHILFLCCGLQIAMNYFNIDWFYQGQENYKYITFRSILVKLICFIAVFFFVRSSKDYVVYALISSLAVTFNNVFNAIYVRRFVRLDFSGLHFKRHFAPLCILALSVFLSNAYSKIDITMLGAMATDTAIGLYNNAHKIVEIITIVCTSFSAVFLPRLSYYYEHGDKCFEELIGKGIKILSFIAFPAAVGLFILAPQIIRLLYGVPFLRASVTVRIFTILVIIKSFGNLLCYQLVIATGNEKKRLPAYFLAAILNIIFNALLIPHLAQNGAAIASVISEFVVNTVQLYMMAKIIHISVPSKSLLQGLLTSSVMGGFVFFISRTYTNYFIQICCGVIIGSLIYLLLNFILKNEIAIAGIGIIKKKMRRRT